MMIEIEVFDWPSHDDLIDLKVAQVDQRAQMPRVRMMMMMLMMTE